MKSYEYLPSPENGGSVHVLMPFYSAEEENALKNRRGPFSVIEILKEVFNEDFFAAVDRYVETYPDLIKKFTGRNDADAFRLDLLSEPRIEDCFEYDYRYLAVDLVFDAVVNTITSGNEEGESFHIPFEMRYFINYHSKKCSVPTIGPRKEAPRKKGMSFNRYLLPVMYSDDYADVAEDILVRYYPEARDEPIVIDGRTLAKRMGLRTRTVRFPKGSDMQGLIFFSESKYPVRNENGDCAEINVPPMTILVNRDLCSTPEIENSTIVHECAHAYLDHRFFLLQSLSGNGAAACMGKSAVPKRYAKINNPIEWAELQAEKLPAYILMPEYTARNYIEELYDYSRWDKSPENVMRVVTQLAEKFGVSKSMAKYRMIELGFPEAEGIYCFIDKKRTPDHGCSGAWRQGITYTISRKEAAKLITASPKFHTALRSGQYAYVEGHYCLDSEVYIRKSRFGGRRLTEYARSHIDECCISFSASGRYAKAEYSGGYAARKTEVTDKYQNRHSFDAEPESKERTLQNDRFKTDAAIWEKLRRDLPQNFGNAIQLILDEKGISQNELALRLGVSRASVRKWCAERVTLRHVIALCIALDVRADIGEQLVVAAGLFFRRNSEDELLHALLFETRDLSVSRANEIMEQAGLPKLTYGEEVK